MTSTRRQSLSDAIGSVMSFWDVPLMQNVYAPVVSVGSVEIMAVRSLSSLDSSVRLVTVAPVLFLYATVISGVGGAIAVSPIAIVS